MKNWLPLVPGPLLAMDNIPFPVCLRDGWNSSSNLPPKMELPPRPVPVGSPPWIMKSGMIRWKMTLLYLPESARPAKFLQVCEYQYVCLEENSGRHTLGVLSENKTMVMSP